MNVDDARELARLHLAAELPRRWTHVCAVAAKAEQVARELHLPADVLVSAAWLHDLGYAPDVQVTGFHPLDGARFLRRSGCGEAVVRLVANHSCAVVEAEERGLEGELRTEFPQGVDELTDALWFCDMTVGPTGDDLTVHARLAEIRSRYGPDHVVTRFVDRAEQEIVAAVERVEARRRRPARA